MTIGDNIVETMSVNKTIHTPAPSHSKLGCLLFSTGSLNSSTTLLGGGGGEVRKRESFISPFEVGKKHLKEKCITDFLTDYRHTRRMQLEFASRLWYWLCSTYHMQGCSSIIIPSTEVHSSEMPGPQYINFIISGKGAHFLRRIHGSWSQMCPKLSEEQNCFFVSAA